MSLLEKLKKLLRLVKIPDNTGLPEDFRIEAFHSVDKFYNVKVTGNGGKTWKYLQKSTDTVFPLTIKPKNSGKWGNLPIYDEETFNASEKSISWYRKEIKNYEEFEKYNAEQYELHLKRCKIRYEQIDNYFNKIKNNTQ